MQPKELEERVKRAVAGAGIGWTTLDASTQAMLVEVGNELLRAPLRALARSETELQTVTEAKERYRATVQALMIQLGEASVLSSEAMAIAVSPAMSFTARDWVNVLQAKVRLWLDKTQRVTAAAPVRGGA